MRRGFSRCTALVGFTLFAAVAVGGCAGRNSSLGSGEVVDACAAYGVYDSIPEPSPTDARSLVEYAEGMVRFAARVRDFKVPRKDKDDLVVPKSILDDYATIGRSMAALRDSAKAAGRNPAKLKAAANGVATDRAYLGADRRVTDFFINQCPRGQ